MKTLKPLSLVRAGNQLVFEESRKVFAMRIPYISISLLRQKMQIPYQSRDLSLGILFIDTQR